MYSATIRISAIENDNDGFNVPYYVHVQLVHQDLDSIHDEYLRLREKILKQLEGIPPDSEQAKFLRSELEIISQKLGGLQGLYSAYIQRYAFILEKEIQQKGRIHFSAV